MGRTITSYGVFQHGKVTERHDVFPHDLYRFDTFLNANGFTTDSSFVLAVSLNDDSEVYLPSNLPDGVEHIPCEWCMMGISHTTARHSASKKIPRVGYPPRLRKMFHY